MAHAGTIDLGGSAQTKQSGSRWPAVLLTLVVVVATIAAVWFASSAGLVGGTAAKPAADRSYDAIEAQRGAITLSGDRGYDAIETQRGFIAPPVDNGYDMIEHLRIVSAQALVTARADAQYNVSRLPYSMTSGTFHPGKEADQLMAPAKRDRVGGQ